MLDHCAMADIDIDIYDDLYLLSPSPAALASPAAQPSPVASQEQQPRAQALPQGLPPGPPTRSSWSPQRSGLGRSNSDVSETAAKGPQTWVAPGYEHLAPRSGSVTSVLHDGRGAADESSRDAPVLEDTGRAAEGDRSNTDESSDEADGVFSLGEIRASEVTSAPTRKRLPAQPEAPLAQLPLPGASPASTCDQFVLLGGLPPTLPEAELRRLAEKFGQLNAVVVLEDAACKGKSAGIALLEYSSTEGASRAAGIGDGLCASSAWPILAVSPPRLVLVGQELLGMMRAGSPPWPEGGGCSDDLRCVLLRQFEQWTLARRSSDTSPPRALSRQGSGPLALTRSSSRGSPEPQRREEGWAAKLRALKRKVNSKQDLMEEATKRERL